MRSGYRMSRPFRSSALNGDNLIAKSDNTPWYNGPALLEHLETVECFRGPDI